MGTKATVTLTDAPVGTEFTPELLSDAVTPEVLVPNELAGDLNADNITITGNLVVEGTMTGAGVRRNIMQMDDVDSSVNPQEGFALRYNTSKLKFEPQPVTDVQGIGDLSDTNLSNLKDLSILQYDLASNKWVSRTEDEFYDATIDGGLSNSAYVVAFDIDGGFA